MIDVSILIVCYKSRDLIAQCLDGVYAHTNGCTFEVLLLDCSGDGAIELVRTRFPQVRIIENHENLGFGKGNNVLAQHATGKFVLLLNPDVIVENNAIGELYQAAVSFPDAGAVGGRTRLPNGQRDPGCRQTIPSLFRMAVAAFGGAKYLNGTLPEIASKADEVETLSGAFMLVRRDAWEQLDGFDTSFFMYSEELDLCYRLRQQGWKIVMTPRAEVIHLVGSGQGQSPRRIKLLTTARMHFVRKFWGPVSVFMAGALLWLHAAVRVLIAGAGWLVIGRQRASNLWNANYPIVSRPWEWWYGFHVSNEYAK